MTMVHAASVEIDITPPIGGKMAGYGARTEVSQGILHMDHCAQVQNKSFYQQDT
jgi:hypothetical protein